jgi:undecaprenyl diphosphate synthase
VPAHIAIIMDGNGRWARQRGQPRLAGHEAGSETWRRVLNYCRDAGSPYLTLYAFSTEKLGARRGRGVGADGPARRVYCQTRARTDRAPGAPACHRAARGSGRSAAAGPDRIERATEAFERQLIIALSYSGRSELARAARRIAEEVKAGTLAPEAVDEAALAARLDAPDVPDPDLIIRTSGELRISNFLLWQCAYSEFYVTPVLWPDFREADFQAALAAYAARDRRFGGVGQVAQSAGDGGT